MYINTETPEDLCKKLLIQKLSEFEVFGSITVPPAIFEAEATWRVLGIETVSLSIYGLAASSLQTDEPPLGLAPLLLKVEVPPMAALKLCFNISY